MDQSLVQIINTIDYAPTIYIITGQWPKPPKQDYISDTILYYYNSKKYHHWI